MGTLLAAFISLSVLAGCGHDSALARADHSARYAVQAQAADKVTPKAEQWAETRTQPERLQCAPRPLPPGPAAAQSQVGVLPVSRSVWIPERIDVQSDLNVVRGSPGTLGRGW